MQAAVEETLVGEPIPSGRRFYAERETSGGQVTRRALGFILETPDGYVGIARSAEGHEIRKSGTQWIEARSVFDGLWG